MPSFSMLLTLMKPPIAVVRDLAVLLPIPMPSVVRIPPLPIFLKVLKRSFIFSFLMPLPVSVIRVMR